MDTRIGHFGFGGGGRPAIAAAFRAKCVAGSAARAVVTCSSDAVKSGSSAEAAVGGSKATVDGAMRAAVRRAQHSFRELFWPRHRGKAGEHRSRGERQLCANMSAERSVTVSAETTTLRLTLSAKLQKKSFADAVLAPFIKAFNKKQGHVVGGR